MIFKNENFQDYYATIFEDKMDEQKEAFLSQALCLPVSVKDLVSRNSTKVIKLCHLKKKKNTIITLYFIQLFNRN